MVEVWLNVKDKDVENYEVSSHGRVRNATTGRVLKARMDEHGYMRVNLSTKGVKYTRLVHILVADAFLGPCPSRYVIGFIDGDRTHIWADNLEYISRSESAKRLAHRYKKPTHLYRRVRCVETGEEFESIGECSMITGISRNAISRCVNNPFLQTREGFHFELVE